MFSPSVGSLLQTISPYVPERVVHAAQWVQSNIPAPVAKVAKSGLGKQAMSMGLHSVGMAVGTAYPTLTISYATGNAHGKYAGVGAGLAAFALGTALSYATTGDASMSSACSFLLTSAGTIAGGMIGLNLDGQEVETPMMIYERQIDAIRKEFEPQLESYRKQAEEGGGDTAEKALQETTLKWARAESQTSLFEACLDSYVFRTLQYCVVMGVIKKFPIIPLVQLGVGMAVGVKLMTTEAKEAPVGVVAAAIVAGVASGKIAPPLIGLGAYYAKEVGSLARALHTRDPNSADPTDFTNIVKDLYHDTAATKAGNLQAITLVGPLLYQLVGKQLLKLVDQGVAAAAIVRALNEYLSKMQDDDIERLADQFLAIWETRRMFQKEIKALEEQGKSNEDLDRQFVKTDEQVKDLENQLKSTIYQKMMPGDLMNWGFASFGEKKLTENGFRQMVQEQVDDWMAFLATKEKSLFRVQVFDNEKYATILNMHLFNYLIMTALRIKDGLLQTEVKALTEEENERFYRQLVQLVFSPYRDFAWGRGVEGLVDGSLLFGLRYGKSLLAAFLESKEPSKPKEKIESALEEEFVVVEEVSIPAPQVESIEDMAEAVFPEIVTLPEARPVENVKTEPETKVIPAEEALFVLFFAQLFAQIQEFFISMGQNIELLFKKKELTPFEHFQQEYERLRAETDKIIQASNKALEKFNNFSY